TLAILAARLARAVYHMLRKEEAFDEERFFNGKAKPSPAPRRSTKPAAAQDEAKQPSTPTSKTKPATPRGARRRAATTARSPRTRLTCSSSLFRCGDCYARHRLSPCSSAIAPGQGAGVDRLPATPPSRPTVAWSVPAAWFAIRHQFCLLRPPGQGPIPLLPLRRRRQRAGPVGGAATTAAAYTSQCPGWTTRSNGPGNERDDDGDCIRRQDECPHPDETKPTEPGSYTAERRHARDERNERVLEPIVGDLDPAMHPCATIPDLAAWIGPRHGSAYAHGGSEHDDSTARLPSRRANRERRRLARARS